jgi:hypothetical protein
MGSLAVLTEDFKFGILFGQFCTLELSPKREKGVRRQYIR